MGMSFIISRNIDGDTTGSQLLGSRGSEPLSTTLRSSIQRLKDSRGGSMPVGQRVAKVRTWNSQQGPLRQKKAELWVFFHMLIS